MCNWNIGTKSRRASLYSLPLKYTSLALEECVGWTWQFIPSSTCCDKPLQHSVNTSQLFCTHEVNLCFHYHAVNSVLEFVRTKRTLCLTWVMLTKVVLLNRDFKGSENQCLKYYFIVLLLIFQQNCMFRSRIVLWFIDMESTVYQSNELWATIMAHICTSNIPYCMLPLLYVLFKRLFFYTIFYFYDLLPVLR